MIYDIESLKKTILLIKELKSKSAYIFRLFGVHCSENAVFWNDLAKREYERVKIIQTILEMVELNPGKFHYHNNFENASIQMLINSVEDKTQQLIENKISGHQCLLFAETIMNTIIEKEYYHIVESEDNEISTIISEIVYEASQHYEKFAERIKIHIEQNNSCC